MRFVIVFTFNNKGETMKWRRVKKICCAIAFLFMASLSLHVSFAEGPETVTLDDMAQYYEPVEFDHVMHVDVLGEESCATCHHHTVGTKLVDKNCLRCHAESSETEYVACRDCHVVKRFGAEYLAVVEKDIHLYHVDKPGLKGAFHQRCLGCHKEMEVAADCQVCHVRTDAGDKLFYSGKYTPASTDTSSH